MASTSRQPLASTSRQPQTEIVNAFAGLAPPSASASTSATTSSPLPCNVFINHRGPDVKHKLATDIYNALTNMGLNVFLDSHNLHLGDRFPEALQQAMSRASLHLAIFSPTYAQSPWCLAELSFMLKTATPIIPIFYRVQPNDLRHLIHGKGIYAASFLEHEKKGRYSIHKLQEWKMALHEVSFYTGESIDNYE
ncbi:probable 2' cyclic ADP-D-ribose synthase BdTIR [Cryptomeria japonica]|uniref:probable 2' cyclic ADP-D-ribose synthase BdTIR n=1 Tax=Cryptomeria japonica TaxID=3369 RepID=UPI0027D9DD1C|nr:probable 2' cyclic ADP-D-ribose synthase BdTIR [Cryptomeria japonica]